MNQAKFCKGIICVLAIIMLSSCGGGGGDDGGGDEECQNPFTIPATGTVYVPQPVSPPVLTGPDTIPADEFESAVPNPQMSDNITSVFAYPIGAPSNDNNIVVNVNGAPVGAIYLYTLHNLIVVPPGMTWQLYSNSILDVNPWTSETLSETFITYDSTNWRFVITFPDGNLTANYYKVVVDNAAPAINFTEVVPLQVILGTPGASGCAD